MEFERIEAPSLGDLFVKAIEEKILTGELKPGERLMPERALAQSMGVSLAVVHNGLKRLETLGFVRIVPRQGTFINDYVRAGGIGTLNELIKYAGGGYDMNIIRQFADLRKVLEVHFFEDACTHCSDEELDRMKDIMDRYLASANVRERAELYFDFIHEVAIACGNIVSPMLLMTFRDLYTSFYAGYSRIESVEVINHQMTDLYEMLKARDHEHIGEEAAGKVDEWLGAYNAHYSSAAASTK